MARYVRVSRYAGGMGLFITQRPDATSVPTMLRGVCRKTACFRVKGATSSRMVLGDDAVAAGAAPHMLLDSQKGVVVLDQGGEEGHITLKTDFMTIPEFREICLRGRQLRIDAGTLTGFAAEYGKADLGAAERKVLLDDCLAVLEADGVDRARTKRLLELLTAYRPDRYQGLGETDLQARLREAGAGNTRKLGPLDGMANPNGYTREQLADALGK
jgi:S-DNA-T family DNA segregation ATPase FtsK/SpoIIIE